MQRISSRTHFPCLALLLAAGCSSAPYRSDLAAHLDRIDKGRLRAHVRALAGAPEAGGIGARAVGDDAATRRTLDYLTQRLLPLGFELHEESVQVLLPVSMLALVRPLDDPQAQPIALEVAPALLSSGPQAMAATSRTLTSEGWQVDGYRMGEGGMRAYSAPNLIAVRRGIELPQEVVELSAHYDSVPYCPGASDNASGVAALLEIAEVLATASTRRTVRLCFFGAEELGLRGSTAHLEAIEVAASDEGERVLALINLDSVGFTRAGDGTQDAPPGVPFFLALPQRADFVAVIGEWSSGWLGNLVEDAIDSYAPELPYYSANRIGGWFRDAGRSDHANYWRAGLPAAFLTDTGDFRSHHYHTPSDTPGTLDYTYLESITRATAAALLQLAGLAEVAGAG